MSQGCAVVIQHVELLLREIADVQAFGRAPLSRQRFLLARQSRDQWSFSRAVLAQDTDAAAAPDHKRNVRQYRFVRLPGRPVAGRDRLQCQQWIRHAHGSGKAYIYAGLGAQRRQRLHPCQRLDPALRLLRFGRFCLETVDEALQEIGSASCRARVWKYVEISVVAVSLKKKKKKKT